MDFFLLFFDFSFVVVELTVAAEAVTTDTEVIYSFRKVGSDEIDGKLRLAGYLNPQSDSLYFEAQNRAVSITDYTLTLKRSDSNQ